MWLLRWTNFLSSDVVTRFHCILKHSGIYQNSSWPYPGCALFNFETLNYKRKRQYFIAHLLCVTDYALNIYSFTTENCCLLGYYMVSSGKSLDSWFLKMGLIGCSKTLVGITTTNCVITQKSAVLIYFTVEAWKTVHLQLHCISVIDKLLQQYDVIIE